MSAAPDPLKTTEVKGSGARLLGIAVVMLLGIAAVAGSFSALRADEPGPGPLGSEEGSVVSLPQETGRPAVFSLAVASNSGDEDAVIDDAQLVGLPAGIKVVETKVSGNDRESNFAAEYDWPSKRYSDLHDPKGFAVPPEASEAGRNGVQLIFVLRSETPGRYAFRGVDLDYRVGDRKYRNRLDYGFVACYRKAGTPERGRCRT